MLRKTTVAAAILFALSGCVNTTPSSQVSEEVQSSNIVGTTQPFASDAIYFVMTDRFVDGDPSNNYPEQGGEKGTFDLELVGPDGQTANVGYMGGDLQGVLNNAQYIADMGFGAIWLTPIVDNPDEVYTGGEPIEFGGAFKDGGKTGYHGYWANNFYVADEHYVSDELDYKTYTDTLRDQYGIKSVFDIVGNHGSPSFDMPVDQPKFGELYDLEGNLVADHQNLKTEDLDPNNPLHQFFHTEPDIMQLSNLNEDNPELRDYLINSYLYWIGQGADAFRVDTIKHVPHHFWKEVADRVREQYPDFFIFGESFSHDANFIAQHTLPKNGDISVLDFVMKQAMVEVFQDPNSDFAHLVPSLHLTHGPYNNVYELTTFYDNHDMPRLNATDEGFIDAHNWLFTVRGIPVVYQGSEVGFMRGTAEHAGNRNYLGQEQIDNAPKSPIYQSLAKIANVRKNTPALQRGIQINLDIAGQTAAFYRVLTLDGNTQTALVLLNKGDTPAEVKADRFVETGEWTEQLSGAVTSTVLGGELVSTVAPHGVQVWVRDGEITSDEFNQLLHNSMDVK